MAERLKAPVLKTGDRKIRGFESHRFRQDNLVFTQALVLNSDYKPHAIVPWKQAWSMVYERGVAYVLRAYEGQLLRSPSMTWEWPAVIVLKVYARRRKIRCNRENLFARDDYRCGYCGVQPRRPGGAPDLEALSFDHIIPRAQSNGDTVWLDGKEVPLSGWENLVTACHACNRKKADRTPEQARMTLLTKPRKPTGWEAVVLTLRRYRIPDEWKDVLPEDSPWRSYWEADLE